MRPGSQSRLRAHFFPIALLSMLATGPVQAQEQPAGCRLHIWPSSGLKVQAQLAGEYFGNIYAVDVNDDGKSNYAASPTRPLNTVEQLGILQRTELLPLLGLQNFALTPHDQPLTSTALRAPSRYADDQVDCYAELVISDVVFSYEYARGFHLRMFVRFRQFGTGSTTTRTLATWVQAKIPAQKNSTREELKPMLDSAYVEGLKSFGGYLQKPPKSR